MNEYPMPESVSDVFTSYPPATRRQLSALREMIFKVAAQTDGVGALEETLKWGQISYLTPDTKSGTTIRIGAAEDDDGKVSLFVHCQTTLIETFRQLYGEVFEFEGTRSIRFSMDRELPVKALEDCIAQALTYHLNKKRRN